MLEMSSKGHTAGNGGLIRPCRRDGIEAMDQNPKTHPNSAGAEDRPGHDLLSLSMMPVKQSLRLYAEIQRSALETFSRLCFAWTRPFTGAPGKSSERAQTAEATPRPTSAQTPVAPPRPTSAKPTTAPPSGAPSKPAGTTRPAATTKPAPPKVAAK